MDAGTHYTLIAAHDAYPVKLQRSRETVTARVSRCEWKMAVHAEGRDDRVDGCQARRTERAATFLTAGTVWRKNPIEDMLRGVL
jgi:hypothetical protein